MTEPEHEVTRVPFRPFRISEEPKERTVRERYEAAAFLRFNHIGRVPTKLIGSVKIIEPEGRLHEAHWQPAKDGQPLADMSYDQREHIAGALRAFLVEIDDYDRDEAQQLVKRHAEHHHHLRAETIECSCGINLGITTVAYPDGYHPEKYACRVCEAPGVFYMGPDQ